MTAAPAVWQLSTGSQQNCHCTTCMLYMPNCHCTSCMLHMPNCHCTACMLHMPNCHCATCMLRMPNCHCTACMLHMPNCSQAFLTNLVETRACCLCLSLMTSAFHQALSWPSSTPQRHTAVAWLRCSTPHFPASRARRWSGRRQARAKAVATGQVGGTQGQGGGQVGDTQGKAVVR